MAAGGEGSKQDAKEEKAARQRNGSAATGKERRGQAEFDASG